MTQKQQRIACYRAAEDLVNGGYFSREELGERFGQLIYRVYCNPGDIKQDPVPGQVG